MEASKEQVREFWDAATCGERLYLDGNAKESYLRQSGARYKIEPYIAEFAGFDRWVGKRILEIGVGLGADHQRFAEAGAVLWGIDLTERAVAHARTRFELFGLKSQLSVGDAENLGFEDDFFDMVFSWGVIHHTPDTPRAVQEIRRVLKPGGEARIMIYHKHSFVGYMLWFRYAFLRLQPFMPLTEIYSRYLERPGTKAYTTAEARALFSKFIGVDIAVQLTHGDLLTSGAGQRHRGWLLALARRIWPRRLIRTFFPGQGLFMIIRAVK